MQIESYTLVSDVDLLVGLFEASPLPPASLMLSSAFRFRVSKDFLIVKMLLHFRW